VIRRRNQDIDSIHSSLKVTNYLSRHANLLPQNSRISHRPIHRRPQRIHQTHNRRAERRMQSQSHIIKRLAAINHQFVRILAKDLDGARIHCARRRAMLLPFVHIAAVPVGVYLRSIGVGHDDGAVRAAQRAPDYVRTGVGGGRVVDDNGLADGFAEFKGRVGHHVVDGVVDAVGGRVADGKFVDENPFLDGWDVGYYGHAGAGDVLVVGYIVDYGAPGLEIG
jgi:hypothetical protein